MFLLAPASPIIEDLQSLPDGLDISWKSDVTSKQEKYVVVYVRNDTGRPTNINTTVPKVKLTNLYPGAGYVIKVYAFSHGLLSEPHISFTTVYPNPPLNLSVDKVRGNKVTLKWQEPLNSLYTSYVIKYRPEPQSRQPRSWTEIADIQGTEYTLDNLLHGEQYEIEVDSVAHRTISGKPLSVFQIIEPQAIDNLQPILDAENVTLQWPRPEGRVDLYHIKWFPLSNEDDFRLKEIPGNEGIGRNIGVLVGGLHPGVEYMFEITTEAHGLRSETTRRRVRTMPLITSEITVINQPEVTTALTLRYTPTPLTSSLFDTYRFMLSDANIPVKERAAQDPDRKVTFVDLMPGRLYNITVWTVSGEVTSKPLERQDRLHPEPVSNLNATRITDNEITLVWQPPIGDYDHFNVLYYDGRERLTTNSTSVNSITISRLRPFKNYTFTVSTISGTSTTIQRSSAPISAQFATKESVPGSLTSFAPIEVQPSWITFEWDLPTIEANGIITGFVIEYGSADPQLDGNIKVKDFLPEERKGTIESLNPGDKYVFQIKAKTRVGSGSWVRWEQQMPIWAPPVPDKRTIATELSHTMTTVTIRFRRSYFSDENGQVKAYAIIVGEDYTKPTDDKSNLLTWHDVQSMRVWPPYQASDPYYPFNNSSVEDFTVGVENCENKVGYCNGPLKPGTVYRFKIRAYTYPGKFSETHWSQQIQTDPDNTAFLVGIIIPIILLLLVALILLGVRRVRNSGGGSSCLKRSLPGDMRHGDNISLPDSVIETSKPVKLKDFSEHYRIMSADSDFRFSEEYEELKHVGREKPCTAADMPVNRPKNRFTNILPYDHSRVKLQPADDEEGSDYINANFVPGFNSPREFIVTQGMLW